VIGVVGALARTPLSGEQHGLVRLIESSAQTLERLLTDVLDLARIEAGRFDIRAEPFEPAQTLRDIHALFEPRAREKGLVFELILGSGCADRRVGDAGRLRQIAANLVSNALKFTEAGFVRLRADAGDGRLRLEVEDSGIGFPQAIAERLFERFQQADGSITRRYGGSGLGLAISRTLAEHMGGALTAASEPGRGSVFSLSLPLALAGDAPTAAAAPAPAAAERRLRVLLAEDHPTTRKVVELILAAADVELTSVCDGGEAVAAAKAGDFDLVLMDMQMPVMDGLSATREIRAWERVSGRARTPILALTANALAEHARASRAAGADGHIAKPISAPALLDAIAAATAGAPGRAALSA
jgi:CheY-like chemotaxis protein